jgi:type VI secretion system protein VasI
MKFYLAVFSAFVLPHVVQAQEQCVLIDDNTERLACYDNVFSKNADSNNAPTIAPSPKSDWNVRLDTSDMTDQTNVYLTVTSKEPVQCTWQTEYVRLILRCMENTTAVVLATPCHVTSSNYDTYGDVTYRVDSRKAKTRGFEESTNNRSLGLWNFRKSRPFIEELYNGETLLMRFTPFSENAKEVAFDISGLEDAIKPLRESCGW